MNRNDHYYTANPTSESRPAEAAFTYRGQTLRLMTDAGVFSRGELDAGTRILLNALPEHMTGAVLDLGCGWGPGGYLRGPDAAGMPRHIRGYQCPRACMDAHERADLSNIRRVSPKRRL